MQTFYNDRPSRHEEIDRTDELEGSFDGQIRLSGQSLMESEAVD
jgi:hypothetical protein